jgi:hypothetical protein
MLNTGDPVGVVVIDGVDVVGVEETGDADEIVVLNEPTAVIKTVGGALEGGRKAEHEIPV